MKKRWIALGLCLALALSGCGTGKSVELTADIVPTVRDTHMGSRQKEGAAVMDFGLRLFQQTADGAENALVSPLSAVCALAMAANGAEGATLAELEAVFGVSVDTMTDYIGLYLVATLPKTETLTLSLANAVWFRDDPSLTVEQDFLNDAVGYFDAAVYRAPFDQTTCREINDWVEEHTDGMVTDILDGIPADAVLYLVNALAFDGEWAEIYTETQVRSGTFTTEAGEAQAVELMYGEEWLYLEDETATGFLKPYAGERYVFAALLPNEGVSLSDYVASLTGERLTTLLQNPSSEQVVTAIPKFQLEYTTDLRAALQAMGVELAFAPEGDFSGMGSCGGEDLYISRVLHKTYLSVDERGTRAVASTVVQMDPDAAAPGDPPKRIILDRPFLCLIIDRNTGVPVFIGAVTDLS